MMSHELELVIFDKSEATTPVAVTSLYIPAQLAYFGGFAFALNRWDIQALQLASSDAASPIPAAPPETITDLPTKRFAPVLGASIG